MAEYSFTTLLTERRGAALWVTLNRPEALNTLTTAMVEELLGLFTALETDREVRVVVLRGAGRAFCAGLDLKDFLPRLDDLAAPELLHFQRRLSRLILAMRRCPQPVVCLWHGAASGGGFALGLASDLRYCTTGTRLNASFVLVGLSGCDVGVSWLLPRLIGAGVASELLFTGRTLEATRARELGLVSAVVEPAELESTAERTIAELLTAAPMALALTKQALQTAQGAGSLEAAIEIEDRQQTLLALQPEFKARLEAFAARQRR
ncbi:MAG: enoyl-CoA hydratase/isomerase family protein [Gammaproteobacteria bacterium]